MNNKKVRNEYKQSVKCKYARPKRVVLIKSCFHTYDHHGFFKYYSKSWKQRKIKKQYMKKFN